MRQGARAFQNLFGPRMDELLSLLFFTWISSSLCGIALDFQGFEMAGF